MESIKKYFPELTQNQVFQFEMLYDLYVEWNSKINVISRKDIENLYVHHVLHALAIAKVIRFNKGSTILDVGTGGGFPGIPLAIMFPDCKFYLADSINKKITVVKEIQKALGLNNVMAKHTRAEDINETFDFVVSRAVTTIPTFIGWTQNKIKKQSNNAIPNGILYLKGGDFSDELKLLKNWKYCQYQISDFFDESYFIEKSVIHLYQKKNPDKINHIKKS